MPVGELSERMTSAELMEWIAWDRIHHSPAEVHTALICLTMVQLLGNKATLDDFLPKLDIPDPVLTQEEINYQLIAWVKARIIAQGQTFPT